MPAQKPDSIPKQETKKAFIESSSSSDFSDIDRTEQPVFVAPPQNLVKKPFVPMLKVGGLGMSTLKKEGGVTQEEQDVAALVAGNKQPAS